MFKTIVLCSVLLLVFLRLPLEVLKVSAPQVLDIVWHFPWFSSAYQLPLYVVAVYWSLELLMGIVRTICWVLQVAIWRTNAWIFGVQNLVVRKELHVHGFITLFCVPPLWLGDGRGGADADQEGNNNNNNGADAGNERAQDVRGDNEGVHHGEAHAEDEGKRQEEERNDVDREVEPRAAVEQERDVFGRNLRGEAREGIEQAQSSGRAILMKELDILPKRFSEFSRRVPFELRSKEQHALVKQLKTDLLRIEHLYGIQEPTIKNAIEMLRDVDSKATLKWKKLGSPDVSRSSSLLAETNLKASAAIVRTIKEWKQVELSIVKQPEKSTRRCIILRSLCSLPPASPSLVGGVARSLRLANRCTRLTLFSLTTWAVMSATILGFLYMLRTMGLEACNVIVQPWEVTCGTGDEQALGIGLDDTAASAASEGALFASAAAATPAGTAAVAEQRVVFHLWGWCSAAASMLWHNILNPKMFTEFHFMMFGFILCSFLFSYAEVIIVGFFARFHRLMESVSALCMCTPLLLHRTVASDCLFLFPSSFPPHAIPLVLAAFGSMGSFILIVGRRAIK